jgi:rhodanese-related sulfurtransferase
MSMKEIEVSQLAEKIAAGYKVVDVRELNEYNEAHIPSAVHVPLQTVPDNLDAFRSEQDVFVVCQVGGRSGKACQYLIDQGVTNVVNVAGGTAGWMLVGNDVDSGTTA